MTYWKVTDKILTSFNLLKVLFVFSCVILKDLFTDLCVRWNLHSEIGLNEKKIKFSHDSKITIHVFNTLSSKFPQIITNVTEDTELAFTERLERLCLIIILFIMIIVSHILNESKSNIVVEFSYECSYSFPKLYIHFRSFFLCN